MTYFAIWPPLHIVEPLCEGAGTPLIYSRPLIMPQGMVEMPICRLSFLLQCGYSLQYMTVG